MSTLGLIHYGTAALTVAVTSIGVGLSQGWVASAACKAINIQPSAKEEISRTAILGSALIETASIMGVFMFIILFLETSTVANPLYSDIAKIGIGLAICISGLIIGLISAWPAQEACLATARQPFMSQKIFRFMLITLSIIQTPLILAFIIALLIKNQANGITTFGDSLRLFASGFSIGIGSIGPALGLAQFARTACRGIGINRDSYDSVFSFTFVSQAIIETPIIFALLISFALLLGCSTCALSDLSGYAKLAAGLCMGLSTLGPGLSSGKTAATACEQIALKPHLYATLSKTSIFAQGIIDTCAIYALIISLTLILFI